MRGRISNTCYVVAGLSGAPLGIGLALEIPSLAWSGLIVFIASALIGIVAEGAGA